MFACLFIPIMHLTAKRYELYKNIMLMIALIIFSYKYYGKLTTDFLFTFHMGILLSVYRQECIEIINKHLSMRKLFIISLITFFISSAIIPFRPLTVVFLESLGAIGLIITAITYPALKNLLNKKPLRFLGRVSYSFYLYHYFILTIYARIVFSYVGGDILYQHQYLSFIVAALVSISITLLTAHYSYKYIEIALKQRLSYLFQNKT
jgi:peptidoglycan/LPS O-acetylase OafA/YrhL